MRQEASDKKAQIPNMSDITIFAPCFLLIFSILELLQKKEIRLSVDFIFHRCYYVYIRKR